MTGNNAKIVLAVGVTALFVSVALIAGFLGYLYLRQQPTSLNTGGTPVQPASKDEIPAKPRDKGSNLVAAADITRVTFSESLMGSNFDRRSALYFGNINVQNFTSTSRSMTFSSDGSATKRSSVETTVNGVKSPAKIERYAATIDTALFAELAKALADNDFANEPDSRDITSLPIKKILTITYNGAEKTINTGHMGRNSLELSAMLNAVNALDRKTVWKISAE